MNFSFYQQLESNDCGITCVRMICSFFGKEYSLKQIKGKCEITKLGITVSDIINCCKELGVDCLPVKCGVDKIEREFLPMILHWKQNHFVVLYRLKKKGKEIGRAHV